ncbi:MAG: hypothetical protein Q8O67_01150 [Deltaproteobacteria bacterium]|nr:hypothetical protein [Deltaproteobacteria bacterium]
MIGIPLGIAYSNAFEWFIHKHLLHGLGRNKKSFWAFHWHEHHKKARKNDMIDDQYNGSVWSSLMTGENSAMTKEALGLIAASMLHAPLLPVAPFFTITVWACAANYYRVHKKSHLDPAWAKEHLPWHVDHHMGKNQDANWCVTWPMMDWLLNTREKYVGTEAFEKDEARKAGKVASSSAPAGIASTSEPVAA